MNWNVSLAVQGKAAAKAAVSKEKLPAPVKVLIATAIEDTPGHENSIFRVDGNGHMPSNAGDDVGMSCSLVVKPHAVEPADDAKERTDGEAKDEQAPEPKGKAED